MDTHSYQEALDYLYSFVDYSIERSYRYSPEVFDLGRVRGLLNALGDPHEKYPTIHVAGTKGKGSVSAMVASVLQAAGYRTGLYTSPHLQRFTERIRVNGLEIGEADVVRLIDTLRPHVASFDKLTTYEIITALCFLHFAQQEVDCAVVEVGLGGRLDATNVISPLVCVITSLSYDHMHLLGGSLSDIAREKAGIIKPGVPVVTAPQQYEAERVVEEIANSKGAPLIRIGRDWLFSHGSHDLAGQTLFVWSAAEQPLMDAYVDSAGGEEWVPPRYQIPLLGFHQVVNGAVAYAALQVVNEQDFHISEEAIREGFQNVYWPGRFQVLSYSPVILVDSAHNRDSALKLRIALDDYFPGRSVILIFGASADKDIAGMFNELLPRVSRLIVTQAEHPRSAYTEEVAELARSHGVLVDVILPSEAALSYAVSQALPEDVILAAGSIFIAGEILAAFEGMGELLRREITEEV